MDLRRVPRRARWPLAYVAVLALSAGLGALTPLGAGNTVFLAGAACVLGSLAFVRLGGERTIVGRNLQGVPEWGIDPEKRRREVRRGMALFAMGLALWAALGAAALVR
ncbi:MAG TPA: hypothetical protein VNX21_07010 [Candidatus Thermoplasmatota archaeon]|nr:hypothetical protein [Candidatus Thermoplasmatota archaeon]